MNTLATLLRGCIKMEHRVGFQLVHYSLLRKRETRTEVSVPSSTASMVSLSNGNLGSISRLVQINGNLHTCESSYLSICTYKSIVMVEILNFLTMLTIKGHTPLSKLLF